MDFDGSDEAASSDVSGHHTGAWDSAWPASRSRSQGAAVCHQGQPLNGLSRVAEAGASGQCTPGGTIGCRRATASTETS